MMKLKEYAYAALLLLGLPSSCAQDVLNTRGIAYPGFRYVGFDSLDNTTQENVMTILNYTEREWNFPGTNKLELSSYEAIASESGALSFNMTTDLAVVMSKQGGNMTPTAFDVLVDIGFEDEDQYDCWVNHYADYYWLEMEAIVIEAWQILGWGPAAWLGAHPAPASDDLEWAALNETEREAAIELCYLQETWDGLAITSWTTDYAEFDSNVDESMRRREVEVDAEEDFPVDDIDEELHQFQVRAGI